MKAFFLFFLFLSLAQAAGAQVIVVELNDAITPASDDIISEALANAQISDAQALIITMNTPGGGLDETKRILDHIQNSPVPVIGESCHNRSFNNCAFNRGYGLLHPGYSF